MENHKLTIIIPTRERATTLYWAIKTCLNQDYENLEVIICDNFSSDNTREVVAEFESDKRVRYLNWALPRAVPGWPRRCTPT